MTSTHAALAAPPAFKLDPADLVEIKVAAPTPAMSIDKLGVDPRKCYGNTIDFPWTSAEPLFRIEVPRDGKLALVGPGDTYQPGYGPVSHYLLIKGDAYICEDVQFLPRGRYLEMKAGDVWDAYPLEQRGAAPVTLVVRATFFAADAPIPADLPTVELAPGGPNPSEIAVTLPAPRFFLPDVVDRIAGANSDCNRGFSAQEPIMRIRSAKDVRVRVTPADRAYPQGGLGHLLFHGTRSDYCAALEDPTGVSLKGGEDWLVYEARDASGNDAVATRLSVFATDRPYERDRTVAAIDDDNGEPLFVDVKLDAPAPRPDGCEGYWYGTHPAALLTRKMPGPLTDLVVTLVGFDASVSLGVQGWGRFEDMQPGAPGWIEFLRRPFQCNVVREVTAYDQGPAFDVGSYPIYIGVAPGATPPASVRLMITSKRTEAADPFAVVVTPGAQVPAAKRSVMVAYPMFGEWSGLVKRFGEDAIHRRIMETAPRELFVFATRDLGPADLRDLSPGANDDQLHIQKGEPFLVLRADDARPSLLALDGTRFNVPAFALDTTIGAVVIPSSVRPIVADSIDIARRDAGPEDAKLLADFDKKMEHYGTCAERVWKSVAGDLPAGYDLLIVRGTHSTSVRNAAENAVWNRCGGAATEKLQGDVLAKLNASRAARRLAMLQAYGAIVRRYFPSP